MLQMSKKTSSNSDKIFNIGKKKLYLGVFLLRTKAKVGKRFKLTNNSRSMLQTLTFILNKIKYT